MLPLPASPFERIMQAPSLMRRSASPRFGGAADEGHREAPLVDVVGLVGRGEDLGLVDVVDAERLEDLCFDEVPDAGLGHDGDRHRRLDALDHLGIGHAGHAALAADVGRHPLERHDRDGAGVLGDAGVIGRDHVHDHPALQHLGEAALDPQRAGLAGGRGSCEGVGGAGARLGHDQPV